MNESAYGSTKDDYIAALEADVRKLKIERDGFRVGLEAALRQRGELSALMGDCIAQMSSDPRRNEVLIERIRKARLTSA